MVKIPDDDSESQYWTMNESPADEWPTPVRPSRVVTHAQFDLREELGRGKLAIVKSAILRDQLSHQVVAAKLNHREYSLCPDETNSYSLSYHIFLFFKHFLCGVEIMFKTLNTIAEMFLKTKIYFLFKVKSILETYF